MENSTTSALSVTNSGILPKRNESSGNFILSALSVHRPSVFPKNNDLFTKKSLYISTDITDSVKTVLVSPILNDGVNFPKTQGVGTDKADVAEKTYDYLLCNLDALPIGWSDAIKHTIQRKRHEKITEQKWQAIINQIYLWINKDLTQLQKIIKDGWTIQDIFGCHKRCPEQRTDHMGLLMLIQGKTIERVNMVAIVLKTSSGVGQCFYKNILYSPEAALICNLEQGSNAENRASSTPPSNSLSCMDEPDTSETIESIATVIDGAGLKKLSKWIKPTSNNPTGLNLNIKLGEQQKGDAVTKSASPLSSIISSSYSSVKSFIADLEKVGGSLASADERLQIDASKLMGTPTGSADLSNIIEDMKAYMAANKDEILKYFKSAASTIN